MARRRNKSSNNTKLNKLNNRTQELLVEAVERGLTKKSEICIHAEISVTTLDEWFKWADDSTHTHYLPAKRLVHAMQTAKVKTKLRYLGEMERAGSDDWRMWEKRLKWLDPDEYSEKQNVNLSGEVKTVDSLTDEQRIAAIVAIFDAARKRASQQPTGDA